MVDVAASIAVALLLALGLRVFVFEPFTIPSSSMEPGLLTGDYIIVSKFDYGVSRASIPFDPPLFAGRLLEHAPARGDVIVFRLPRDPSQNWIKRVIGLPGDRVQVRGGRLFLNGRALPQTLLGQVGDHDDPLRQVPLVREDIPGGRGHLVYGGAAGHEGDDTDVYVVPRGYYFMMGDNRDNSLDSRWPSEIGVGFLPAENIVGKARFVLVSWKTETTLFKPWTWLDLQWDRFLRPIG
jgi:signal peptidase I